VCGGLPVVASYMPWVGVHAPGYICTPPHRADPDTCLTYAYFSLCAQAYAADPDIIDAGVADMLACRDRDPACVGYSTCLLYFKGFQALQAHRVAHWLACNGRVALALALQSRVSEVFHVDIHPGAMIGRGVLLDHATGVVIGETAVVGDNVSMLHAVSLGGSGTGSEIRHPTVGHGVLLGAGVAVLGPVVIGAGSKVRGLAEEGSARTGHPFRGAEELFVRWSHVCRLWTDRTCTAPRTHRLAPVRSSCRTCRATRSPWACPPT
jgi:serine O-acetyltransferase